MPGAFKPGEIYNVMIPAEHCVGHEEHDNPTGGPRPWIIVGSRFYKATRLVLAVPLTRSRGEHARADLEIDLGDIDTRDCSSPVDSSGTALVCQVRALSVDRFDMRLRGRLKKLKLNELLGEVGGLLESVR